MNLNVLKFANLVIPVIKIINLFTLEIMILDHAVEGFITLKTEKINGNTILFLEKNLVQFKAFTKESI